MPLPDRPMNEISYVLQLLFDCFEEHSLPYCVVGDTRTLPQSIASDVDLVVSPDALAVVPRLMAMFCRSYDLRLVQMIRHESTALYFVMAWGGDSGELRMLAIDVCSDYRRAGRTFLRAADILAARERALDEAGAEKGFYVPAPYMQFVYYLIKRVDKLDLRSTHDACLSGLWRDDRFRARRELGRFWRHPSDVELIGRAAENEEWSPVRAQLRRLRRALRRAAPRGIAGLLGELRRALSRLWAPTGLVVAFLGPDGAGKTSVINRVLYDLAPAFRRTHHAHLRPRLLLSRERQAITEPHGKPVRGVGGSLAKLGLFVLDYAVGYLLRIWPDKCRSTLVAFDRYLHDMRIDPRRFRYGGPASALRIATACVPSPDLWIVLDAPAEVLQRRSSEVPHEESERQRDAYLGLAHRLQHAVVVDGDGDVASVAAEAELEILRHLEHRLEERHAALRLHDNPRAARVLLFLSRHRIPVLSRLIQIVFNCEVNCRIRFPILMPHPFGIVVHSKTVIGRHVTVMQHVTLGSKDLGESAAPVIDDDVYIGAGAKVLGSIRVGRGVIIGANAVVTRDVPPYCTVVATNRIVRGSVVDVSRDEEAAEGQLLASGGKSA